MSEHPVAIPALRNTASAGLLQAAEALTALAPQRREPKTLIVVSNPYECGALQRDLADRDKEGKPISVSLQNASHEFYVVSVGSALYGHRFRNIMITDNVYRDAHHQGSNARERLTVWIEECLQCRLLPGGKLIRLP